MGFFDDLSRKASETYKNTAEKTNKLTREMKLKSLINDDKNKIEKIYAEIGKKVYEKHIREENIDIKSELIEECSKIDAYAKEIEDMNMEMLSLKGLRICNKCAAEIAVSAKFCPKCGAEQEEIKSDAPVENNVPEGAKEVVEVAATEDNTVENIVVNNQQEVNDSTVNQDNEVSNEQVNIETNN